MIPPQLEKYYRQQYRKYVVLVSSDERGRGSYANGYSDALREASLYILNNNLWSNEVHRAYSSVEDRLDRMADWRGASASYNLGQQDAWNNLLNTS